MNYGCKTTTFTIFRRLIIMANYRFLYVPGHTSNYTCATDSQAMKAAKKYLDVMKKIHPNIKYVSVWKYIGYNRYSLIGKHEN